MSDSTWLRDTAARCREIAGRAADQPQIAEGLAAIAVELLQQAAAQDGRRAALRRRGSVSCPSA